MISTNAPVHFVPYGKTILKVHPTDSGDDSSHHFKGNISSFTPFNSCPETDSVKDPLFNLHHLKLAKSFKDSLSIKSTRPLMTPAKFRPSAKDDQSTLPPVHQGSDSNEEWYIRWSPHGEEELYVSNCTVVWSKSDGRGINSIIKTFTLPREIKHAMWTSFPVEELIETPTNSTSHEPSKSSFKCPNHSIDRLPSTVICDGVFLEIYTDRGDHIPVSLQFTISKVVAFSSGILLERSLQQNENEVVSSGGKLLRPLFYVLTYPLNEITPVMMKPYKNLMNSIASYSIESKYTLVDTIVEYNLVILYSRTEKILSIWRERKASPQEVKSAVTAWGVDLSTAAATINGSNVKATNTAYGSLSASVESPFGNSFQAMQGVLSSTMKNLNARRSTSISSPTMAQFKSLSSPMSTVLSSRLAYSPSAKDSPNQSVFSPSAANVNSLTGARLRQNLLSYETPRSSPRVFDYSRVDCIEKAILPEICLESIWQEPSICASGVAKKVYTTRDVLGQVYICFQCESKLKLLKFDASNAGNITIFQANPNVLEVTDSQPLASLSMFIALDSSGNLVLYSGLHKMSIVYLPMAAKPLIDYTGSLGEATKGKKGAANDDISKGGPALSEFSSFNDSLNVQARDGRRSTSLGPFFSPRDGSIGHNLPKTSSRPPSACKNTHRSFIFHNASNFLSPVLNVEASDNSSSHRRSFLANASNISNFDSTQNPLDGAKVGEVSDVHSLRDGAGDKVTVVDANGFMYRVSFPPITSSTVVSMLLTSLSAVLPKDLTLSLMSKWYCMRNSTSLNELTDEKELLLFKKCLLTLIGYEIEDLLQYTSFQQQKPAHSTNPSSSVKKEAPMDTSGDAYLDAPPFSTTCSSITSNQQTKKVKLDVNSIHEACSDDWNRLLQQDGKLASERAFDSILKDEQPPSQFIVDTSNILTPTSSSLLYAYSPYILYALHLTYEEVKLHQLLVHFNESLVEVLYLLASDLHRSSYQDHYFRDHPSICTKIPSASRILESDFKCILFPSFFTESPPSIYSFLQRLSVNIGLNLLDQSCNNNGSKQSSLNTNSGTISTLAPYPIISQSCVRSRLSILFFASLGYTKSTINNNTLGHSNSNQRSSNASSQTVNNGQRSLAFHEHDLLQPIQVHSLKHHSNCHCYFCHSCSWLNGTVASYFTQSKMTSTLVSSNASSTSQANSTTASAASGNESILTTNARSRPRLSVASGSSFTGNISSLYGQSISFSASLPDDPHKFVRANSANNLCFKGEFSMPSDIPLSHRLTYAMDKLFFQSTDLASFPPGIAFVLMQSDLILHSRQSITSSSPSGTLVQSRMSKTAKFLTTRSHTSLSDAVTSAPIPDHKLHNLLSKISTSINEIGDFRTETATSTAGSSVSAALAAAAAAAGSNSGVVHSNSSSAFSNINMINDENGFSYLPCDLLKQLFPEDQRVLEAHSLLTSSKPVKICIPHRPGLTDHELMEEQERHLYTLCIRTLALPIGRGMFTLRTYKPVIAETFPIPTLCLTGRVPPRNTTVELTHIEVPANIITWPLFHNGVAAGLRACPSASKVIDSSWIMYNRPKSSTSGSSSSSDATNEHAGFLLALGLNGHLDKLSSMNFYDYLGKGNELTRVAVLLGLAAARKGSMDTAATKMLSIHVEALLPPSSTELDIQPVVQVASVLGIGLLYAESGNSHMAEVLLCEIGRPPGPEMEHYIDRESYALAAGLAFGLITLGKGNQLIGGVSTTASTGSTCSVINSSSANFVTSSATCNLPPESGISMADQLFNYMMGGHKKPLTTPQREKYKTPSYQIREGDCVNADVTSPGATLGLGMLFFDTGNETVASWVTAPDTQNLLETVRPDFLLLRTLAKGLIMWSSIEPSKEWIDSHIPPVVSQYAFRKLDEPNPRIDYETISQAYCNIVSGAALVLGLKFAGTANEDAFKVILKFTKLFLTLQNKPQVTEQAGRSTIECSLNVLIISLSLVMAGTGNLEVMKICRYMRSRTSQVNVVLYGSHMATHMALGFLFLGGCKYTLSRSPFAIASLIIALFPKFPIHSNDNRYHLQAFRHLYVLAVEPKAFLQTRLLGLSSDLNTQFIFHKLKSLWQSLPSSSLPGEKINTIKVDKKVVSMWSLDTLATLFTSSILTNDSSSESRALEFQQILSSYLLFSVNHDYLPILDPLIQLESMVSCHGGQVTLTSHQIWQLKLVIAIKCLTPLIAERFETFFQTKLAQVNKKALAEYLKGVTVIDETSADAESIASVSLILNLPPYGSLTPLINLSSASPGVDASASGQSASEVAGQSSVKSWTFVEFIMNLRHFALPMSTLIYLFEALTQ